MMTTHGQGRSPNARFVADEIIVKFRPNTTATQRDAVIRGRAQGLIRRYGVLGIDRVRLRGNQTVEEALAAFRAQPEVQFVGWSRRSTRTTRGG
jgi:hypothetical protein